MGVLCFCCLSVMKEYDKDRIENSSTSVSGISIFIRLLSSSSLRWDYISTLFLGLCAVSDTIVFRRGSRGGGDFRHIIYTPPPLSSTKNFKSKKTLSPLFFSNPESARYLVCNRDPKLHVGKFCTISIKTYSDLTVVIFIFL